MCAYACIDTDTLVRAGARTCVPAGGGWRKPLGVSASAVYPEVFEKGSFIVIEQARLAASRAHRHVRQNYRLITRSTATRHSPPHLPTPAYFIWVTGDFSRSDQWQAKADFGIHHT